MKTYRENRNPSKAARNAAIDFMMDNLDSAIGTAAKVLAYCYPNRYSFNGTAPNRLARQTAREIPSKFGQWLLTSKQTTRHENGRTKVTNKGGYLVTHCGSERMTTGHSFWVTFKGFCKFSQAASPDSAGKARRSSDNRTVDKQTAKKNPFRYRNCPAYHSTVEGAPIVSNDLTAEMKSILHGPEVKAITRRLERGDITEPMAQAEVLALVG